MTDQEFGFLSENMHYRLVELQGILKQLGRPVLIVLRGSKQCLDKYVEHLQTVLSIPVSAKSLFSIPVKDTLTEVLVCARQLPSAGEISLWLSITTPEAVAPVKNVLSSGLGSSLIFDGVLVLPIDCGYDSAAAVTYESIIHLHEQLISTFEVVVDPEMMHEGEEDHEEDALMNRLANPHLDAIQRHAPPIPHTCRALPTPFLEFAPPSLTLEVGADSLPCSIDPLSWESILDAENQIPTNQPLLIITVSIDPIHDKTVTIAESPEQARIPSRFELLSFLEQHRLPAPTTCTAGSRTQHHLAPVWNLLEEFIATTLIPTPDVFGKTLHALVLDEAWYSSLKLCDTRFGPMGHLQSARKAEIQWMESIVTKAGIKLIVIPYRP